MCRVAVDVEVKTIGGEIVAEIRVVEIERRKTGSRSRECESECSNRERRRVSNEKFREQVASTGFDT